MKKLVIYLFVLSAIYTLSSCGGQTDVVDSGTYQGTVDKVKAEESEIYVKTEQDHMLELYFTEETKLMENGKKVDFSSLQKGQEVEVEKKGKRLDPLSVKILE